MTIRIVFVDDEINILQAMSRSFHSMREEWNMEFLSSGATALESLAKVEADVIVSDMRMPGMDGWQLLAEVKRLYPQTVRLVLSGQADTTSVMRAVGTAQRYLAKPCASEAIKAAIAVANVGPKSAYVDLRILMTWSANAPSNRLLLGRLNRFETSPSGPVAAYRRASREPGGL
jgi:DNA-binding NtrC family response regulator